MTISKKRKIFLVILILSLSMLSANMSVASMNHMDDSKCMMQTTCNNCFMAATTNISDLKPLYLNITTVFTKPISIESCLDSPPFPPPKI